MSYYIQHKGEAHKAKKEGKGEEEGASGEDEEDQVEARQPLDLDRFASVWRCVPQLIPFPKNRQRVGVLANYSTLQDNCIRVFGTNDNVDAWRADLDVSQRLL